MKYALTILSLVALASVTFAASPRYVLINGEVKLEADATPPTAAVPVLAPQTCRIVNGVMVCDTPTTAGVANCNSAACAANGGSGACPCTSAASSTAAGVSSMLPAATPLRSWLLKRHRIFSGLFRGHCG